MSLISTTGSSAPGINETGGLNPSRMASSSKLTRGIIDARLTGRGANIAMQCPQRWEGPSPAMSWTSGLVG